MPKLSDTMEEGGIAEWLKKEGEWVEEGEPLLEIETDKATMEYVSPESGFLLKILAAKGATAALQEPIAVFGAKKDENYASILAADSSAIAAQTLTKKDSHSSAEQPKKTAEKLDQKQSEPTNLRIKASPLAKKIAKEKNIALEDLKGSGPNGRIVLKDVENHQSKGLKQVDQVIMSSSKEDIKIPLTMMRKTIAKRLLAGKNEAPHFYLQTSANMSAILDWRESLNQNPKIISGELPKVSINDLIMFICAKALSHHPEINSSWQNDHILQYGNVHLAMAVALPTGLITPVISHCEQLSVLELAKKTKELGEKAKKGLLEPAEYTGGTFTVSNLGMSCVDRFTAIINPPQAAILAVGRTKKVPYVDKKDQIVVQSRMEMSLSCDHRVIDGMMGAKFLETLVWYLESPLNILA